MLVLYHSFLLRLRTSLVCNVHVDSVTRGQKSVVCWRGLLLLPLLRFRFLVITFRDEDGMEVTSFTS